MVALRKLPPRRMTISEFLDWAEDRDGMWQLRDGEPEMMNPPAVTHGAIQAELGGLIRDHLRSRGSPCRVVITPGVVPQLHSDRTMLVPDLAVTCAPPGPCERVASAFGKRPSRASRVVGTLSQNQA